MMTTSFRICIPYKFIMSFLRDAVLRSSLLKTLSVLLNISLRDVGIMFTSKSTISIFSKWKLGAGFSSSEGLDSSYCSQTQSFAWIFAWPRYTCFSNWMVRLAFFTRNTKGSEHSPSTKEEKYIRNQKHIIDPSTIISVY